MLTRLSFFIPRWQASSSLDPIYLVIPRISFVLRPFSRAAGDAASTGQSPPDELSRSYLSALLTDYLGVSPNIAADVVRRLRDNTRVMAYRDPKEVLDFFFSRGFTKVQVSKIISKQPSFLKTNVKKTFKPKIDFLSETLGLSDAEIAKLVSSSCGILKVSLEKQIKPLVACLRSNVCSSKDVITVLKRAPLLFCLNAKRLSPKFDALRNMGIPDSEISKFARTSAWSLTQSAKRFNEVIERLRDLGCCPTMRAYVPAFRVVSSLGMAILTRKMSLYRSYGITEDEVLSYFRRTPAIFSMSDQKIRANMEFFIKSLNWNPQMVLSHPLVLTFNLEQRTRPRAMVRSVLLSKGFLKSSRVNCQLFYVREDDFLQKYVLKFQEACPDLLNAYQKAKEMVSKSQHSTFAKT